MTQLIFVLDPMCSWCWGFHPIIKTLREKYNHLYSFSLVMGGLRTKGQMQWDEQGKSHLQSAWNAVHQATNQPFNYTLLNQSHFDYDTYPSCKAVITIRELYGEDAAFTYLEQIQSAFYTKSEDISSTKVLSSYVTQDTHAFLDFFHSSRADTLMEHDFAKARSMGANAFPSTVKIDKDGHMVCLKGYRGLETILNI